MNPETIPTGGWRTHLLITGGVLFTVLLALLLAQLDSLQRQILPSPIAIAITNLNATVTNTPLPAIPLATGTPTAPASPTRPGDAMDTAVSILPSCNAMPPEWALTPISPGETLLSLSLRYNVSAEKIRLANCLEPGDLVNVTALYLPMPTAVAAPTAVCGPPANWVSYTVQRGETMFRLAVRHGTTISAILNANCLTSTNLQAGQRLFLPRLRSVAPTATASNTPTSTVTATGTATNTPTATDTATPPPLPTSSATASNTPTGTVTSTPTASATASATPTSSITPMATPTATESPTVSPIATDTPAPSATPSPTVSPTPTSSATPTNTPVATSTPTATETAVPTDTPVP